jgi:hypothetical protein
MRIPLEHFSTTPIFALSPIGPIEYKSRRIELHQSLQSNLHHQKERKVSLPDHGYAKNSSVGSAPNSPRSSPKSSQENLRNADNDDQPQSLLPTISGMVVGIHPFARSGPTSLQHSALMFNNNKNKYATLPTK